MLHSRRPASWRRAKPKEGPYVPSKGRQKDHEVRYAAAGRRIAKWKEPTLEDIMRGNSGRVKRKNPTKAQKREKVRKASVQRRVASALAKFLHQANPAMKTSGAMVTRLKGGGFTIRPIKAVRPNPAFQGSDTTDARAEGVQAAYADNRLARSGASSGYATNPYRRGTANYKAWNNGYKAGGR
jgi:hypothetical protein